MKKVMLYNDVIGLIQSKKEKYQSSADECLNGSYPDCDVYYLNGALMAIDDLLLSFSALAWGC